MHLMSARCLPWILVCLWCASSSPAPRGTLDEVLLVVTVALAERLHLTRRYERHFGGVAYLVFHGGVPRTLTRAECERRRVGCLFADRGGARRADARRRWRAGAPPRRPGCASRGAARFARGAAVAHMDFGSSHFFAAALATAALTPRLRAAKSDIPNFKGSDLGRFPLAPWLLAAGLNRPPGPPPDDRFRVFARSCLRGAALDGDAEWTWGHNVRAVAARAGQESEIPNFKGSSRPFSTRFG
ncbi:hypothetical protein JL722_8372 [Aureococcus anophagefferens]|nr:hypothetical protein JL722_8372 [Aureococcus anophagefferens]